MSGKMTETQVLRRMDEELAAKDAEIARLKDLVRESAPLAWVHNQDMDGAQEWERRASEALGAK